MNQKGDMESEFFFENNSRGVANLVSALTNEDKVVMESVKDCLLLRMTRRAIRS
jgi:hypothetical protein